MLEIHPLTTDKLKYMNRTRVQIRRCRSYHTSSEIEITTVEIEDGFKIAQCNSQDLWKDIMKLRLKDAD